MAEWPWRYRLRSKVITRDTPHASDHLCLIWNDSMKNWMCYRADRTRCAIFWQFYYKVMTEWPWRYRSRSKVMHGTPSYAGDHLCLIWNKANLRDLIAATGLVISNLIQIIDFSAHVTLKFDEGPRKMIGHLFHTTSSFMHHFKSMSEFKPKLVRKHSIRVKIGNFLLVWPWNLMDDLEKW